jgi:hypothetical protein
MSDAINDWRQAGVLHLWRYKPEKSGLKGWHFRADEQGLNSIIGLAEVLGSATYPAKRTVQLAKPSERTVNGPFSPLAGRKVIAPVSLQLSVDGDSPDDLWELVEEGERAKLRLGRKAVAELLDGLRELKERGYGDFSVGPTRGEPGQNIWLW